ncbi:MAG TPA: L-histidine N(alpha)-methyltransferase [Granulicella sp.]|jgi:dimethylhistidine N-methyltransferase
MIETLDAVREAVLQEALGGLTASPKTLSPWLFYDECGSRLFEQITALPEYYLTRVERSILAAHADEIFLDAGAEVTIAELGAGTAAKTGLLLKAATRFQDEVLYQPIDVSPTALEEAAETITANIPGVSVRPRVANYITEQFELERPEQCRILTLYIGSSIGNFIPAEAAAILRNLRAHLEPGDSLLLGTDMAPGKHKSVATLLAAYDDAAGVTAAFNKNILVRLNRELDAGFDLEAFAHRARWNASESRIEMHLESLVPQTVLLAGKRLHFAQGETIHTENSYKFTEAAVAELLASADFEPVHTWKDANQHFSVTLARAV